MSFGGAAAVMIMIPRQFGPPRFGILHHVESEGGERERITYFWGIFPVPVPVEENFTAKLHDLQRASCGGVRS